MLQSDLSNLVFKQCALCASTSELQASHIIPGFVFDWLRDTSATGHFRSSQIPDRHEVEDFQFALARDRQGRCLDPAHTDHAPRAPAKRGWRRSKTLRPDRPPPGASRRSPGSDAPCAWRDLLDRLVAPQRFQRHPGLEFRRKPASIRHLVFLRYPVEYTLATCPIFWDHLTPHHRSKPTSRLCCVA